MWVGRQEVGVGIRGADRGRRSRTEVALPGNRRWTAEERGRGRSRWDCGPSLRCGPGGWGEKRRRQSGVSSDRRGARRLAHAESAAAAGNRSGAPAAEGRLQGDTRVRIVAWVVGRCGACWPFTRIRRLESVCWRRATSEAHLPALPTGAARRLRRSRGRERLVGMAHGGDAQGDWIDAEVGCGSFSALSFASTSITCF